MLDTFDPLLHPEIGLPDSPQIWSTRQKKQTNIILRVSPHRRAVTRVMPAESGDWSIIASPPHSLAAAVEEGKGLPDAEAAY